MSAPAEGLKVEGLERAIGGFRLRAAFALAAGERMVIQAPSGAGKSSLLRAIAGLDVLDALDAGRIELDGRDITRVSPPQRGIGFVFQEPALFDSMSLVENVAFGLRMRGVAKAQRREQALEWLRRVGMERQAGQSVHSLSGGERQRIAFARALIWRPRLLLLDEPFSALDVELRRTLRQVLRDLLSESPVPAILVTHDREDAEALATSRWSIRAEVNGSDVRQLIRIG